mmetsp:Transcript_5499/g.15532  ORF Transcript_5499/g.15532 Transcript_5499/m.15532 type:complete len:80 (+) Transcript_5499:294-533(+)
MDTRRITIRSPTLPPETVDGTSKDEAPTNLWDEGKSLSKQVQKTLQYVLASEPWSQYCPLEHAYRALGTIAGGDFDRFV